MRRSVLDPLQTSEGDAQINPMSWLLSALAISPFILAFLAYWRGLHTAAKLLPKERLKHGDFRVVPDLYSPESSHRWFGIIVAEKTGAYSRRLRHALALARLAVVLLPFAFVASIVLHGYLVPEPSLEAGVSGPNLVVPVYQ